MPSSLALMLCTFPADQDGIAFARTLVEERLAACVNVLPPMQSFYRWQGQIEQASEHQLIIKTTASQVDELKRRIAALHPYDVPEILVLQAPDGAERYMDWVRQSVGNT